MPILSENHRMLMPCINLHNFVFFEFQIDSLWNISVSLPSKTCLTKISSTPTVHCLILILILANYETMVSSSLDMSYFSDLIIVFVKVFNNFGL